MLKRFFSWLQQTRKRWLYGLSSLLLILSLGIIKPEPSYGISWLELLFRGVQTYQICNMSLQQEVRLGQQINQQVKKDIKISQNQAINRYINRIGQRLAAHSDRPDVNYTFQVVNDDTINAFATMGGFVYMNTGLIKAAVNEAELASVVAHEIGHIDRRHSVDQLCHRARNSTLLSAAGLDESTAVNIGVELALNRPNSRSDESEADEVGLNMLRQGGYAPYAMVTFMETLMKRGGASPPTFLSTHPATSDRIRALKAQINPATANVGNGLNSQSYRRNIRNLR